MNQRQLQIARAAIWRQTANPVLTLDDATAWLEETGLCLFLPRHAQLPAPAPSLVEACAGEARAAFSAAAIDSAMELVTRLVSESRAVPLNLMGNFSEQPDFLASPDALRWIAAVRGDRNWKAAPGGRTAPIVARTWEALNSGEKTVAEIQEVLGRELTEGAVLRALIELWTTLRAFPRYERGQPTRWALAKDRFPRELGAAASTAQTTALSALISLYLRSAVAATAEETEIFLSPLTARSRVREVLHGMMATRQLGTMALGVNTLLFVEGSLPEMAPEPEIEQAATPSEPRPAPRDFEPHRERHREQQRERPAREARREPHREGRPQRPDFVRGKKPPFRPGQRRESGPARGKPGEKRRDGEFAARTDQGRPERGQQREGGWKPQKRWQQGGRPAESRSFSRQDRPSEEGGKRFEGGPPREKREGVQGRPPSAKLWEKRGPRDEKRFGPKRFGEKKFGPKQFGDKKSTPEQFGEKKFAPKEFGEKSSGPKPFGEKKFGPKQFGAKRFGPRQFGDKKSGPKPFGAEKFGQNKFGATKFDRKPGFPGSEKSGADDRRPGGARPPFRAGDARPGKPNRPGAPKWQNRTDRKPGRFGKPQGKSYRKPGAPPARKPRKPREREEES